MSKFDESFNFFDISYEASEKELNKKYKKLCLKLHPDKNEGKDAKFKELQKHWERIKKNNYKPSHNSLNAFEDLNMGMHPGAAPSHFTGHGIPKGFAKGFSAHFGNGFAGGSFKSSSDESANFWAKNFSSKNDDEDIFNHVFGDQMNFNPNIFPGNKTNDNKTKPSTKRNNKNGTKKNESDKKETGNGNAPKFQTGSMHKIKGLKKQSFLNGKEALITRIAEDGKYKVRIVFDVVIKENNLI